jgi:hypothetical protein
MGSVIVGSGQHRFGISAAARWPAVLAVVATIALLTAVAVPAPGRAGATMRKSAASSHTVWLCRPGLSNDPCSYPQSATAISATGAATAVPTVQPAASKFDCFYVYPTVSTEKTKNADLKIQPAEIAAAVAQASRFSQVCRVWAPMYRQVTVAGLFSAGQTLTANNEAYDSLLSGWKDYLAHDNHGRPVIFIGHSQGAAILIRLLGTVIDRSPTLRKLMVSALIMGGNVQVPTGKLVGGSFAHIPLCSKVNQNGCVIAYSTFGTTPPATSFFGRPGQGVSLQWGGIAKAGQQVACVNPVTFSGASAALSPYFLTATSKVPGVIVSTPWVTYPGLYTGTCVSNGGATWLQVSRVPAAGDPRPTVTASLGLNWGYHLDDVNLALGDLVHDVAMEEAARR